MTDLPEHLKDRYGIRPIPPWRRYVTAGVTLLAILAITWSVFSKDQIGQRLLAFTVVDDGHVSVTWEVRGPANSKLWCVVRAQDINRADVGYATVAISPGQERLTYLLATAGRANTVEILGCSVNPKVPAPPADFPPGIKPPAQPSPGVAPTLG